MKKQSKAKSTKVGQRELFETVRKATDEFFKEADKLAPRYVEAMTAFRHEYVAAARETVKITLDAQESILCSLNITPKVPQQFESTIVAGADALIAAQDEWLHASLSITRQFVKGAAVSAKAATELTRSAAAFWLSFLKRDTDPRTA
jgi:hypothetical protein